jgi:Fur family transcriptional regulator, ferric uptake regulator
MTDKIDNKNDLKRSGLKNTRHRMAILDILEQSDRPIAAEQIFFELTKKDIRVNLSTVYRTLETLADKELAVKLSIAGDNRALFEYNHMIHRHYLVCLGCQKITAIDCCLLKDFDRSLEKKTNYKISGHKLDIYGYCPECRSSGDKDAGVKSNDEVRYGSDKG